MEKIVLYPSPFIGHIISMVELGKLLLTNSPSLSSITIIIPSSPFNTLNSYSTYLSKVSSSFPSITFIFHPAFPLLHELSSYNDQEQISYENLRRNNNNVVQTLQSLKRSCNISAFIIDFFCYTALEVSQSLNIPTYFFIIEIAVGLEKSGVRFLWVVRAPPSDESHNVEFLPTLREPDLDVLLPNGFIDRTKDRGLVVKLWVPQIDVLQHGAVGGFVTHCGWNSTLEGVYCGVPMVAWPLYAEQKFNKIVLVKEIGIALPLDEYDDGLVSANEIEKRVKQIMCSEDGILIRKRVMDLKHEARSAFDEGGSSKTSLSMLIESWK